MHVAAAILAVLCLMAATAAPAEAAIVTAASHRATEPRDATLAAIVELLGVPSMPIDRQIAQTFVAGTAGTLQSISVTAGARNGAPVVDAIGLSVSMTTFTNGQPGVLLGSAPVQNVAVVPSGTPFPATDVLQAVADFTPQNIQLEAGRTYAMVFSAEAYQDSFMILGNQLKYPTGEMGGNQPTGRFNFTPVADIFFDVKVEALPEPTTASLAAMLAALLAGSKRKMAGKQACDSGPR